MNYRCTNKYCLQRFYHAHGATRCPGCGAEAKQVEQKQRKLQPQKVPNAELEARILFALADHASMSGFTPRRVTAMVKGDYHDRQDCERVKRALVRLQNTTQMGGLIEHLTVGHAKRWRWVNTAELNRRAKDEADSARLCVLSERITQKLKAHGVTACYVSKGTHPGAVVIADVEKFWTWLQSRTEGTTDEN